MIRGLVGVCAWVFLLSPPAARQADQWTTDFASELTPSALDTTGRNPYFVLEPGYQLVLEGGATQLTITVTEETKLVDGVQTRVVVERETERGEPTEVSRNYFAINTRTNAVFYFGEEVDTYKNGKVSGHEGAWLAGTNGARAGLMMPGTPLVRGRYYEELAPKVAMDRAEIVGLAERLRVPAGEFACLRIDETTPLEPGVKESKYYARDIGLVQDGSLKLVRYGAAR
jgi:hypothetical protein